MEPAASTTAVTLSSLIQVVGATLLEVTHGDIEDAPGVSGVAVYDPLEATQSIAGMVVLGVGVSVDEAPEFIARCAAAGAAAVVLRQAPVAAVAASNSVVLVVPQGVPWSQVVGAISAATSRETKHTLSWSQRGTGRQRSLSDLANAIAVTLDAPVTIEDLNSVVLGYSDNQTLADVGRQETVLGRAVPERYMQALRKHDVFARLYASDEPLRVDLEMLPELGIPRIALRITNGGYVVGSIWVATEQPVSELDMAALRSAAERAAELIDSGTFDQDRRRSLVGALIEGDAAAAASAVAALELSETAMRFLVVDLLPLDGQPLSSRAQDRLADTMHLQLAGYSPRAVATAVSGMLIGILPAKDAASGPGEAVLAAERFHASVKQIVRARTVVSAAVAPGDSVSTAYADVVRTHTMLGRSKVQAAITTVEDSFVDVVLHEVGEQLRSRAPELATPVSRLIAYDEQHQTDFVLSLVAYLRAFGQVQDAANELHIHTNTLRYRLRRLAEISGLDLQEHRARFLAMIELRLHGLLD